MAALASDWLRHFRLLLWNCWTEFNETWQEARSQRPLPSLCFSGRSVNKNVRLGQFLKEVAHCTQVHDMWPFGPLVYKPIVKLCWIVWCSFHSYKGKRTPSSATSAYKNSKMTKNLIVVLNGHLSFASFHHFLSDIWSGILTLLASTSPLAYTF